MTVPNQKVIHINKRLGSSFLQVGFNDVAEAARNLTPSALKLYLYLASNREGYDLALSPADFEATFGVKTETYRKAVAELGSKGYLVLRQGNIWDFYSSPRNQEKDKK